MMKQCNHPTCGEVCRREAKKAILRSRKPIRKQSESMIKALTEYNKLKKAFMKFHPLCEIPVSGCTHQAVDVHHMAGRGKQLLNVSTWKAACRNCHDWVTEHSREAIEMGYSVSRLNKTA